MYISVKFSTLTSPIFNYYHNIFYLNDKKIIPLNLEELLTSEGLAYWAMDDGNKRGSGFRISSSFFSKAENLKLIQLPATELRLKCSLHIHSKKTNQYRIYIKAKSMNHLTPLVWYYLIFMNPRRWRLN